MQELKNAFNNLKPNERIICIALCVFLILFFTKLFVIDGQKKKLNTAKNRINLIHEQQAILATTKTTVNKSQNKRTSDVINDFLRRNNSSDKLKNIRSTSSGEQRYEIENIEFNIFLDLLVELETNGSKHSKLQLKENKVTGTVNAILVSL